ncbi:MAG TPA: response regulator transcription factor [Actinomycetes bacterium]|nr:response regulator transcription factor [Actinomycetes bacterium]
MSNRPTLVYVYAQDPISQAGIAAQLRHRPEVRVATDEELDQAEVAVVVVDAVDEQAVRSIRAIQRNGCPRVTVVATLLDDAGLVAAVEAGASGLVRRTEASGERLVSLVAAAASGDGSIPSDLLGRLLEHVGRLQRQVLAPRGLSFTGLSEREVEILRLVSEGYDTAEIARRVAYSERTVKNVLHDVTSRLQLRNRSHAVAYALRQGFI